MATSRVIVRDRGYKALRKKVDRLRSVSGVTVGVHGSASGSYDGGMSVVEVATIHELGLGNAPQRSFIQGFVAENRGEVERAIKVAAEAVAKGQSIEMAFNRLGLKLTADIKKRIVSGISPPNTDATEARKGSTTPLIDKGQLINSITHKLEL